MLLLYLKTILRQLLLPPAAPLLLAIAIFFCSSAHASLSPIAHFSEGQSNVPSSQLRSPQGVAVDAGGDVFVANTNATPAAVFKETPSGSSYTQSTVGTAAATMFPAQIAVDTSGNVSVKS